MLCIPLSQDLQYSPLYNREYVVQFAFHYTIQNTQPELYIQVTSGRIRWEDFGDEQSEGQTRHIYLWYGKRASNAECDKLWRKSCICIAAKWVEQHASSHATPPFYWTLLLLSSPLSHLLILLPHFSLDFAAILTNSLSFHLFCSFVRFQKPCKPIFVGLCHSPTLSVATQVKILLPLRIQQQEKEKNTGATTFVEKSE